MKRYIIAILFALFLCVPFQSFASIADNPNVLGTPYDWPDWLGDEPIDPNIIGTAGITSGNIENFNEDLPETPEILNSLSETDIRLMKIEYHLSIISGGVILAVCSAFIWFTILKPLKSFISF